MYGLQEFRMENRRRWTGQGGADSSCCFWSAYHMPGSRRNAFRALSHSSHLPYATGTLNGTTDEETEAVRWSNFLEVTVWWNLQRWGLNPHSSDWLAYIHHSIRGQIKGSAGKIRSMFYFLSHFKMDLQQLNMSWAMLGKINGIWKCNQCFRLRK